MILQRYFWEIWDEICVENRYISGKIHEYLWVLVNVRSGNFVTFFIFSGVLKGLCVLRGSIFDIFDRYFPPIFDTYVYLSTYILSTFWRVTILSNLLLLSISPLFQIPQNTYLNNDSGDTYVSKIPLKSYIYHIFQVWNTLFLKRVKNRYFPQKGTKWSNLMVFGGLKIVCPIFDICIFPWISVKCT